MIASFTHLTANEVKNLNRAATLFLFPLGGLEQHGPHLPLGTKLFEADEMSKRLAAELETKLPAWNFILMPILPLTVDGVTNHFALTVRPHVVRDAIVDQCEQLKRLKFLNFAAVSAHLTPKQLVALEDAAKIINKGFNWGGSKAQFVSVSGARVDSKKVLESPMIALPKEHAGARDTGLILAWNPNLVSKDYLNLPTVAAPKASVKRFISYLKQEIDGYWGNPALATHTSSVTEFQSEIEGLSLKLLPWLERGKGASQFSSGYRYFPMNGSFFKAYLLALIFFTTMLVWVIWSVRDIFEK